MIKFTRNKQRTIRRQIQYAILAITMVSMFVLGICFYSVSARNTEKNYQDDFNYNLKASDTIMRIQLENIIGHMRELLTNKDYMDTLLTTSRIGGAYFTSEEISRLEKTTSEITLQSSMVQDVITISLQGKLYVHSNKIDISQYLTLYQKFILKEKWARKAFSKEGRETVYSNNILTGNSSTVSIVKCMIEPYTGRIAGFLIVNVNKKIFEKAFDNRGKYNTNCFLLIDPEQNQECFYYQGKEADKNKIMEQYLSSTKDTGYVLCTRQSSIDGWVMVSGISKSELNNHTKDMALLIIGLIVVLVACGIIVADEISGRIYDPLRKLELTIQQVEDGNRNVTEEFDDSEIGILGNKFKEMVNHNLVLRERLLYARIRQREQELHRLQEQINPHFLYNTLEALYCMAEIHGADDIARMVDALAKTFRLSLNKGSSQILVSDEIEHIKAYMTIQSMRFNNRFSLEIDVDEVLHMKILKLILEPFVENAIIHGLEPKMGEGRVTLTGRRQEEGYLLFEIQDDGVGVDDIRKMDQGYGINNIRERIRLYYGDTCGVTIESEANKGTRVQVRITESRIEMRDWDAETGNR